MKDKIKDYSLHFFKDIIPVVAGILIALFIDNWNSDRKDKNYVEQVYSTIDSELNDSKEDIKTTIPKHKSLIDSIELNLNNDNYSILDIVMKAGGINIPQIKNNAWRSISSFKIDLVDYNKLSLLSSIDDDKLNLNKKADFLMNYIYSNINAKDKNSKATLKLIVLDIIQTENTIQRKIDLFNN